MRKKYAKKKAEENNFLYKKKKTKIPMEHI